MALHVHLQAYKRCKDTKFSYKNEIIERKNGLCFIRHQKGQVAFFKKTKMKICTFVVCSIILNFAFVCGFVLSVDEYFAPLANAHVIVFMKQRKR